MEKIISKRSEILFLYDVTDANPNGDPLDENKPRIDEETKINIVTDVRLKRTIRDYFLMLIQKGDTRLKGQDIFVKEIEYEPGKIQDAKLRAEDFLWDSKGNKIAKNDIPNIVEKEKDKATPGHYLQFMKSVIDKNVKDRCIDIRLFGVTMPIEWDRDNKSSITYTGPVQFKMGRSLHKVNLTFIKGTGAFASGREAGQKTFREEYILPYSFIAFYGIVNENAAKSTNLSTDDVELLMEGIWNGTKNLISRSKAGQMPRLLLQIIYNEPNFHIGELDKRISLHSNNNDEAIREISEFYIDGSELIKSLIKNKDKIEKIRFKKDDRLSIYQNGNKIDFKNELNGITVEEFNFSNIKGVK